MTLQPIYEGLAQHRWNDAQLAELESVLAKKDFLADYQLAMRGERTFAIDAIENQRITRQIKTMAEVAGKPKEETISLRWMPSAFFYQNELAFAQLHEQLILPLLDMTNRIIAPAAVRRACLGTLTRAGRRSACAGANPVPAGRIQPGRLRR